MTVTQIYILAWASLSMGVVAILLRFLGVKDEQRRANRDRFGRPPTDLRSNLNALSRRKKYDAR